MRKITYVWIFWIFCLVLWAKVGAEPVKYGCYQNEQKFMSENKIDTITYDPKSVRFLEKTGLYLFRAKGTFVKDKLQITFRGRLCQEYSNAACESGHDLKCKVEFVKIAERPSLEP